MFGRGAFLPLNDMLNIFEVLDSDPLKQYTRGYKLHPDIEKAQTNMLRHIRINRPVVRLLFEDGRYMQKVPKAVASKDMAGITATAWTGAKAMEPTPVDIERLNGLMQWLDEAIKINTRDIFSAIDPSHLERLKDVAGKIIAMASTNVMGRGYVHHRYVEAASGRLYAQNINLQTAPKLIKQMALHGLWEYDIENCHYSIFDQMAQRAGFDAKNIKHYLANKKETRQGIADRMEISVTQAKVCLLAIMYGARASEWHESAIPEAIGKEAAIRLYKDAAFIGILNNIKEGRQVILMAQPVSRGKIKNMVGKFIGAKESAPKCLAHLIQGVEAAILKEIMLICASDMVLLQHDGFASKRRLDVRHLERAILESTTYYMELEEAQICVPADLNLANL